MASRQTVDRVISHDISFLSLPNLPFFMHVKICTPICHFNWLKSSNREQNAERLLALLASAQSVSAFSATQKQLSAFISLHFVLSFFFSLLLRVTEHAFSSVMMLCRAFTEGACYPTYLITTDVHHTSQSSTLKGWARHGLTNSE